ncbi:translation elongation factor Ts [Candidatus Salinivivens marinus]|uniref:translation elongation factor Ts n=1 Tax=Candidatus Salinivivens marinus TaxID=3381703 RepID=UPI000B6C18A5|nr:elongation factor Ts [Marinovum sp.]OUU14316.1 MAG: translation elongation factor Ts [Rhodobacteraceae bacterium TMED38]PDH58039.1 MAG: elongation factor Ts [Rhodobacteraceae bacterium MED-G08]|tara:strand:+ start:2892 stop:3767 length:876 start_codon:yes stop_codon:yes gene_type:complete
MAITASMVKELRETTGAGMMDAKKALTETDGDFEAAIDWLRTKGLAKAAKKSSRVAAEGLVAVATSDGKGVAVEVNSETDFVAKNSDFQEMVKAIATAALNVSNTDELASTSIAGKTVADTLTDNIAKIGENMTLRRMQSIEAERVVTYVHNSATQDMGQIGVLVAINGENTEFARQVAMHVAAANPQALSAAELDQSIVEREKNILTEQARESGKPEQVIEKMIQGRMKKFLAEVTLLGQDFVINPDLTVEAAAQEAGVEIVSYVRMAVGEGIEKVEEDFAAEVAKAAQG